MGDWVYDGNTGMWVHKKTGAKSRVTPNTGTTDGSNGWAWDHGTGTWVNWGTGESRKDKPQISNAGASEGGPGDSKGNYDPYPAEKQAKENAEKVAAERAAARAPIEKGIDEDHATALNRRKLLQGLMPKPYNPLGDEANSKIRFARDKAQSLQGLAGYRQSGGMQGYKEADAAAGALNPATADYLKRSQQISSDVYGDLFRRLGLEVGMLGETDQMDQGYNNLRWDFDYRNRALDQNMRLNDLAQNAGMQRAAYEGIGGAATGLFDYLREKGII